MTSYSCKTSINYLESGRPMWSGEKAIHSLSYLDSAFTVVSYNIEYAEQLEAALSELAQLPYDQADVILLQEMDEYGTQYLADTLKYNYVYYPISFNSKNDKNFGNAILSKWPILNSRKLILPHAKPLNQLRRGAVTAEINYDGKIIAIYSLHLETFIMSRKKRLEQLESILNDVSSMYHNDYIIVGGDFNSFFNQDVIKMTQMCIENELTWQTKGIGHSVSKFNILKLELDHIFSKGFRHLKAGRHPDPKASDHAAIWTTLKIAPLPPDVTTKSTSSSSQR